MTEKKAIRLSKLTREFNVGISTLTDFLKKKGVEVDPNPNTKVPPELYDLLSKEFSSEISVKKESEKLSLKNLREKKESVSINDLQKTLEDIDETEEADDEVLIKDQTVHKTKEIEPEKPKKPDLKVIGKIDLDSLKKQKPVTEHKKDIQEDEPIHEKMDETIQQKQKDETPVAGASVPEEEIKEVAKEEPVEEKLPGEETTEIEETPVAATEHESDKETEDKEVIDLKVVGKIDLESMNQRTRPLKKTKEERETERKQRETERTEKIPQPIEQEEIQPEPKEQEEQVTEQIIQQAHEVERKDENHIATKVKKLVGPTVVGRIDLPVKEDRKKVASSSDSEFERNKNKKKRKRIRIDNQKVKLQGNDKPSEQQQTERVKKDPKNKSKILWHVLQPKANQKDQDTAGKKEMQLACATRKRSKDRRHGKMSSKLLNLYQ